MILSSVRLKWIRGQLLEWTTLWEGAGNDILIHGNANSNYDDSDGKRDLLDCGPGDDTVMLNISIDHDEAVNCEHINSQ